MKKSFKKTITTIIILSLITYLVPKYSNIIHASPGTLTYTNRAFYINGNAVTRFGVRAANALESDASKQHLIDNLQNMKDNGIQSVNISLQGAKTGTTNAFNADGSLKSIYSNRLGDILDALDSKEMVGVITFFYQVRDQNLANPSHQQAILNATQNATSFLKPWRNVWLYVINEPFHSGLSNYLRSTSGQSEIYNKVKSVDSLRITYVGNSANDGFNATTNRTASNGNIAVEYVRQDEYSNPGVFTSSERSQAQNDATTTFNNNGYWFWHAAWHQKADSSGYPRYDKGGGGTGSNDRGVSFIWTKMAELSKGSVITDTPTPTMGATQTPSPTPVWDGIDYVNWLINFGKNVSGKSNGDFDNNNTVNIHDYKIWISNYSP